MTAILRDRADPAINPLQPEALLYVPDGNGSLKLVAVEYVKFDADGSLLTDGDRPFFYGHIDDLVWQVMFDRAAGIRFTHSPSGGGLNDDRQTTNPAWDFQFIIPDPQVDQEYDFKVRTILRPRCEREDLLRTHDQWKVSLR